MQQCQIVEMGEVRSLDGVHLCKTKRHQVKACDTALCLSSPFTGLEVEGPLLCEAIEMPVKPLQRRVLMEHRIVCYKPVNFQKKTPPW